MARSTCSLIVFGTSENEVPSRGLGEILCPGSETRRKKEMLGVRKTGGVTWMVAEKRGKFGERYSSELLGPPENGNHGRSHGALTEQRLLYSRIFLFHVKQLSSDTSTDSGSPAGLRCQRTQCEIAHWERCRSARCRWIIDSKLCWLSSVIVKSKRAKKNNKFSWIYKYLQYSLKFENLKHMQF